MGVVGNVQVQGLGLGLFGSLEKPSLSEPLKMRFPPARNEPQQGCCGHYPRLAANALLTGRRFVQKLSNRLCLAA